MRREQTMANWRAWEIGRKTIFESHEFDGHCKFEGIITKVCDDHLVMEGNGMTFWIDDDTAYMFR